MHPPRVALRRDIKELVEQVFADDPKWFAEAKRIEQLVVHGQLEDAGNALSMLLFERHVAGQRKGIDLAIMQAATKLLSAHVERCASEDIELVIGALERLAGPGLDRRAATLGTTYLGEIAGALAEVSTDLARRAAAIRF